MSTETRTRITATPLYPGSFMAESGLTVPIADAGPETAIAAVPADSRWFAVQVRSVRQKRWTDGAGGEMWTTESELGNYRVLVGEEMTAEQVEALPDADDHRILLANMRGNRWPTVVRTRLGNWQDVGDHDVVVPHVSTLAAS